MPYFEGPKVRVIGSVKNKFGKLTVGVDVDHDGPYGFINKECITTKLQVDKMIEYLEEVRECLK